MTIAAPTSVFGPFGYSVFPAGGASNPDPFWQNVVLYLGMGSPGDAPTDLSLAARPITATGSPGGFVADAGVMPGMTAYRLLRDTNSANTTGLSVAANAAYDIGTGDFTAECWFFQTGRLYSDRETIMSLEGATRMKVHSASTSSFWCPGFFYSVPGTGWGLYTSTPGQWIGTELKMGQWHHVAMERSGTTLRLYEDGQPVPTTGTWAGSFNGSILIGKSSIDNDWNGLIGGVRITKGVARFAGTPFVPTFTADGWMTQEAADFSGAGHKFWRLGVLTQNAATGTQVREIEMRASIGGASLNTGAAILPVIVPSSGGSQDRMQNHWRETAAWTATIGLPAWFYANLQEAIGVRHLRLYAGGNNSPKDFELQYSDDASSWTTALTVTGNTWAGASGGEIQAWHVGDVGAHQYWRVYVTAVTSGTTLSVLNFGLGTSAISFDYVGLSRRFGSIEDINFGDEQIRAFDGLKLTTSAVAGAAVGPPCWWGQRLATEQDVAEVMIMGTGNTTRTPASGTVEFSNDGQRWQTSWTYSGLTSWVANEQKVVARP